MKKKLGEQSSPTPKEDRKLGEQSSLEKRIESYIVNSKKDIVPYSELYRQFKRERLSQILKEWEKQGKIKIIPCRDKKQIKFTVGIKLVKKYNDIQLGLENLKKEMKSNSTELIAISSGKILDLAFKGLITDPSFIDFLDNSITSEKLKSGRKFLIQSLYLILEQAEHDNNQIMLDKIKKIKKDFLADLINNDNEEDTSRVYAAKILSKLSFSKGLYSLFSVLKRGKKFVHEEAFVKLFFDFLENMPELEGEVKRNCEGIIEGNYEDEVKRFAKIIFSKIY